MLITILITDTVSATSTPPSHHHTTAANRPHFHRFNLIDVAGPAHEDADLPRDGRAGGQGRRLAVMLRLIHSV